MRKKGIIISAIFFGLLFASSTLFQFTKIQGDEEPSIYFTLVAKTNYGGVRPDYLYILRDQLLEIGINLTVIELDWPTFVGELIAFRDFDICYVDLTKSPLTGPDYTGVYNENGSLNLFGYTTDMDWNETLGFALNEWYIGMGTLMMPPDCMERVHHYWRWQQYMMDKILPCQPAFTQKNYIAYWNELIDFNFQKGIFQSWGEMEWSNNHFNQSSTDELVIIGDQISSLSPLILTDSEYPSLANNAVFDSLVWMDYDNSIWPHLAKSYTFLTENLLRISLREGIKWQIDPEGLFPDEYLDAEDVYFTYSTVPYPYSSSEWIKDMILVDQYTIDFIIDDDPYTPKLEPSDTCLLEMTRPILPEHYLNQTQLADGITPDPNQSSWSYFANCSFGTSLFKVDNFIPEDSLHLSVYDDCWWLNTTITDDVNLDWETRFGDFSSYMSNLTMLCPTTITDITQAFESGYIDMLGLGVNYTLKNFYNEHPWISTQSKFAGVDGFFGFNMRPSRAYIGDPNPCPGDPSISIGLAVRKAICYAMDRITMNNEVNDGEYEISYWPIAQCLGIWCNPSIIKYDYNLATAQYYMDLLDLDNTLPPTTSPTTPNTNYSSGFSINLPGFTLLIAVTSSIIISIITLIIIRRKRE